MIGMFAIPQIVEAFATDESAIKRKLDTNVSMSFPTFKEIKGLASTILKSALIGVGIGAIPGTGGPIAAFLGYDQAKRKACSDEPTLDCVAGPEAAHNGVTGGALIPMLTLGIPGDPATAILQALHPRFKIRAPCSSRRTRASSMESMRRSLSSISLAFSIRASASVSS